MYARVYLNTAMSVFTALKISSHQKQHCYALLNPYISLKNTPLIARLNDYRCRYRLRIKSAFLRQSFVFNRFVGSVQ